MSDLPPPPSDLPPPSPFVAPASAPSGKAEVVPAPLGRRLGALAIDLVASAATIYGLFVLLINGVTNFFNYLGTSTDPYNYEEESTIDLGVFLPVLVIAGLLWLVYVFVLWGQSTSPGKKMLGLYVVDVRTGRRADRGDMVIRDLVGKVAIGLFLSGIPLAMGIIMILVMPKRRSYWDLMSGTMVVRGD